MRKKIFVFLMVIISMVLPASAVENSKYYGGVDIFSSDLSHELKDGSNKKTEKKRSKGARLKGGIKFDNGLRTQVYFSFENFDSDILNNYKGRRIGIGIDLIKSFEVTRRFKPFISLSLNIDRVKTDIPSHNVKYTKVSLSPGLGVLYAFSDSFELQAGVDITAKNWSNKKLQNGSEIKTDYNNPLKPYLGVNFHF